MTRTNLFQLLAGVAFLMAAPRVVLAQASGSAPQSRPSSYGGTAKSAPATGTKTSSTGGAKGTVYGPAATKGEPARAPQGNASQNGAAPVRRTAGDEPVREPGFEKAGPSKAPVGTKNNPIPLVAQAAPRPPDWYPLAPNVQEWVDSVLVAWEKTSEDIITFKCNFKRWEHDPAFGPADPNTPYTYGEGIIQYAKPDKGMFKVESLVKYTAPKNPGDKTYLPQIGEQWVCDGRSIFEFDVRKRQLIQTILPKEMQGKAIADGPLPFLFGAKVSTLKSRYWIRQSPSAPPGSKGEYWLEAVPKYARDAANFQKVTIVLDEKDFLPKLLDVFPPNYHKKNNPAHTEYALEKRETTLKSKENILSAAFKTFLDQFRAQFYEPKVPSGWKKVTEDLNIEPQAPPPKVQRPSPGTATRPSAPKSKTK
jgi:TIGR03009 family protein